MKARFIRFAVLAVCLLTLTSLCIRVDAEELVQAKDLAKQIKITGTGYDSFSFIKDGDSASYKRSNGNCTMTLTSSGEKIASLYLMFHMEYGDYTITNEETGQVFTAGTNKFLHEYIDLVEAFGAPTSSVTLNFSNGDVRLSEVFTFSEGLTPDFVQKWQAPYEGRTDLLLLSTHGDDEQLFFAGLLPLYAGERGYNVQVVYMTDHRNLTLKRTHEMLNGLWATGVTAYPVFGTFDDFLIEDMEKTYQRYENEGTSREELLGFVVEQIRRFRPQVVVGHDIQGEYKHGMHMVYTDLLIKSLDITGDAASYPESAEAYGTWEIPKTYIHLYEENPIVLDYDTPLQTFGGLTAFQVTQKYGYPCHESQQYTWFTGWIYGKSREITKATQIATYNPCLFGLYHTTVGPDVDKNDFMENITRYTELERLEAERLEQERLEAERLEKERLEQERLEAERLEKERLEKEKQEAERLALEQFEKERQEQAAQEKREKILVYSILIAVPVLTAIIGIVGILNSKNRRGKFSKKR